MLSILTIKFFFAISIMLVIIFAGWIPFKQRLQLKTHVDFPIGETLATGVFLGAALLHMLPESNHMFIKLNMHYPLAFLITGIVFLLFLWLEHIGKELYHHHEQSHPAFAILAWIMLSVHSFVLGTALGFSQDFSLALMLFLAIIAHKWAESFALAITLNKSTLTTNKNIILFVLFSLMTPFGIYIGWYLGHSIETQSLFDPILIAVSAGTFLYLGTLHGLERCVMVKRCCNLGDFSFVIVGFLLMAAVALYL
jgi:zinc transporter ZupT